MKKQTANPVKLGLFVLSALCVLILTLYLLGKNRSLFGSSFIVKTHFKAVNGLIAGNNVRYGGITVGNVRQVVLLNDTVVEVRMDLDQKMRQILRTSAKASLGTDGLVGNRVVNIVAGAGGTPLVQAGALLASDEEISTEKMLQTLHRTNENVAVISEELVMILHRINQSVQLTELLNDRSIPANLKASLLHLRETTEKSSALMSEALLTLDAATKGRGTVATLMTDTAMALELRQAVGQVKTLETDIQRLTAGLEQVVASVNEDVNRGPGPLNTLMNDSLMASQLRLTVDHAEKGVAAFNRNMEALQHNFLLRGYFKKQEKAKKKANKPAE